VPPEGAGRRGSRQGARVHRSCRLSPASLHLRGTCHLPGRTWTTAPCGLGPAEATVATREAADPRRACMTSWRKEYTLPAAQRPLPFVFLIICSAALGIEPRTLCLHASPLPPEPQLWPFCFYFALEAGFPSLSPAWPGAHHSPAPASQVLGLQVCATAPGSRGTSYGSSVHSST
jgi:hypothetical protein